MGVPLLIEPPSPAPGADPVGDELERLGAVTVLVSFTAVSPNVPPTAVARAVLRSVRVGATVQLRGDASAESCAL